VKKPTAIIALAFALTLVAALTGTAFAHAKLASSVPAAGAKLASAPAKVTLVFDEEVSDKADETFFKVADASGKEIAAGKLDNTDIDHKTLSGALPSGLGNGVYTVTWKAVTPDDGGVSTGKFSFGVNADPGPQTDVAGQEQEAATATATRAATATPAGAAATATRAATPAATATPAGAAATLPNTGGGAGATLSIAVALGLLAAGALVMRSLRSRA
jgi:copper transport protein